MPRDQKGQRSRGGGNAAGGRQSGPAAGNKAIAGKRRPPGRDDGMIRDDPLGRHGQGGQFQVSGKPLGKLGGRPGGKYDGKPGGKPGSKYLGKPLGRPSSKPLPKSLEKPERAPREGGRAERADKRRDRIRLGGREEGGAREEGSGRGRKSSSWRPGQNKPSREPAPVTGGAPSEPMRIAKAIARAGLCSRREAERWIEEGRVSVNGKVLASPALEVGPRDKIVVDGAPLPEAEGVRLWRYHKPRGLMTTHRDPEGRPTVFDSLPSDLPRVISIGRLDYNTEGLLLLTNDGELARYLELPATGWLRKYRVRARGRVTQAQLDSLKEGVSLEGVNYGPVEAHLDSEQGSNIWLTVGLREGKNREIRKILGALGLEVSRLIRVSFGPFQLLDLEEGKVDRIRRRTLREQLGAKIARDLGLIDGTEAQEPEKKPLRTKPRHTKPEGGKPAKEPKVPDSSGDPPEFE